MMQPLTTSVVTKGPLVAAASSDDGGAETVGAASGRGPVGWMALVAAAAGGGTWYMGRPV